MEREDPNEILVLLVSNGIMVIMQSWKWHVYILECRDGLYYTGLTWNIAKRIDQHQSGLGSDFTSLHGFKALRYVEEHNDLSQARKREYQLKDYSRKKKEALWKEKFDQGSEVLAPLER